MKKNLNPTFQDLFKDISLVIMWFFFTCNGSKQGCFSFLWHFWSKKVHQTLLDLFEVLFSNTSKNCWNSAQNTDFFGAFFSHQKFPLQRVFFSLFVNFNAISSENLKKKWLIRLLQCWQDWIENAQRLAKTKIFRKPSKR